jgi:hypothetical protein
MFSECIKLLGFIRNITIILFPLDCSCEVYFTWVKSKLEYASEDRNIFASAYANKLDRIQQKFASDCFYRFLLRIPYSYIFALEKLSLHFLHKLILHTDALFFFFLFRSILTLNPGFPSWKMLLPVFLLAVLGTYQCLAFVPQLDTIILLCVPMLPTWWVKISTHLQSEPFLSITFYNPVAKIVNNI